MPSTNRKGKHKPESNQLFTHSEMELGFKLYQVSNAWQRHIKKALVNLQLTHVQYLLLICLEKFSHLEDKLMQVQISENAGTNKMMTSKVLRALEARQLIKRSHSRHDNRAQTSELTQHGHQLLSEAKTLVKKADTEFFDTIKHLEPQLDLYLHKLLETETYK
jgi:MarR family transcriptional regulator, organic hydroperoxide resistance regulator